MPSLVVFDWGDSRRRFGGEETHQLVDRSRTDGVDDVQKELQYEHNQQ